MPIDSSAIVFNNPSSGAAVSTDDLEVLVREVGQYFSAVKVINFRGKHDALEDLVSSVRDDTTVFILGGDGTIGTVASLLVAKRIPATLAPIGTGTGNDLTSFFGIDKKPASALRQLLDGKVAQIDYGVVDWVGPGDTGQHVFVNSFGIGYDARVAANVDRYKALGSVGYVVSGVHSLIGWRNQPGTFSVDGKVERRDRFTFISVCNARSSGGGFVLAPEASVNDGLLDYFVLGDISKIAALGLLPAIRLRGPTRSPKITTGRSSTVQIAFDSPNPIHLDGEVVSRQVTNVTVTCIGKGLSFRVPRGWSAIV